MEDAQPQGEPLSGRFTRDREAQLLYRNVTGRPGRHDRIAIEDAMVQEADDVVIRIDDVSETPVLSVQRLQAEPAEPDRQQTLRLRSRERGQCETAAECNGPFRRGVETGGKECVPGARTVSRILKDADRALVRQN